MTKEFEDTVRTIYDYFYGYGLRKVGEVIKSERDMEAMLNNPNKKSSFIKYVHEGYKLGQDILIEELINNEKSKVELNQKLKEHRRDKNKDKCREIENDLKKLKYQEVVLRNLADSLAWLLMQGQHWIARRWHSGDISRPSLLNSNIESLHAAAAHFYKEQPNGFVLYTDLTSFIDIADLIEVSEDLSIKPVEVKEGPMAGKVFDFIHKLKDMEEIKPENMGLEKLENPKKFFQQVDRTVNQMQKASRLTNLLSNEKGPDPFTGQQTIIGEIRKPLRSYHEVVYGMFRELEMSIWSHRIIEDVIYIGMYREQAIKTSDDIFKSVIPYQDGYPIITYTSQLFAPIKEPFFQKRYGVDNIMNLAMGRVRMLVYVDLDALMKLFKANGIDAHWMSRKETQKAKESKSQHHKPFEVKQRAISLKSNSRTLVLGDGFLSRLAYDSQLPMSLVEMYQERLNLESDED